MPGFHTFVFMQENSINFKKIKRKFYSILNQMRHYPRYKTRLIINSQHVMLGFSGFSGYPYKIFKTQSRIIVIEGKVYNRNEKEIIDLLSTIPLEKRFLTEEIKRFVFNSDGEYIIHVYDKDRDLYFLFNDGLGRLPLYYYASLNKIVISKEIKFIIPFLNKVDFNKIALSEYLLFRYPLGKRTLIKNVCRLLPATLLLIDIKNQSYSTQILLSWNLDSKQMKPDELSKVTDKLLAIFINSLKNRVDSFSTYVPVVSLSGGYDSRTVIAGLSKLGAPIIARTYLNKQSKHEVPIAQEISKILNIKHDVIPVPSEDEVKLEDMYYLAFLKDGLNYVAVSHVVKFYETIVSTLGSELLGFTGEGGDFTLAPFLPFNPEAKRFRQKINSTKRLGTLITTINRFFSLKDVSLILDMDKKMLKDHVRTHLSSYPEQTFEGKYKHFKIFEKAFKWLGEGESRNRFFYWFTTPFYSLPFFIEAMKIPQAAKKNMIYYKAFLSQLNSACAKVYYPNPPRKRIINELMQLANTRLDIIFVAIGKVIDKLKKNDEGIEPIRTICLEILESSRIAQQYLNVQHTQRIIAKEKSLINLFLLLTLLLYMRILDSILFEQCDKIS